MGNRAPRGQALVETVLCLPVFLFALYGMLWAVRAAVQYERVQTAVRYSWAISQQSAPYLSYSFYAMYGQLGNTTVPAGLCPVPLSDPLSDASPTYTSTQTLTASQPFWTPSNPLNPLPACSPGYLGMFTGIAKKVDVLLDTQEPTISSNVPVPSALQAVIGATSEPATAQIFYQQISVNGNLACYPGFDTVVTSSLQYQTDSSPATPPTVNDPNIMYYIAGDSNGNVADYYTLSSACY